MKMCTRCKYCITNEALAECQCHIQLSYFQGRQSDEYALVIRNQCENNFGSVSNTFQTADPFISIIKLEPKLGKVDT